MSKKHTAPTIFGACSLLVIFSVLCLVVFALLSLSTAGAGKRLSQISTEQALASIEADYQAEEILAKIRSGNIPEGVTQNGDIYTYSCPISEVLNLYVKVQVSKNGNYTILQWQSIRSVPWQADEEIDLWNPNNQ